MGGKTDEPKPEQNKRKPTIKEIYEKRFCYSSYTMEKSKAVIFCDLVSVEKQLNGKFTLIKNKLATRAPLNLIMSMFVCPVHVDWHFGFHNDYCNAGNQQMSYSSNTISSCWYSI